MHQSHIDTLRAIVDFTHLPTSLHRSLNNSPVTFNPLTMLKNAPLLTSVLGVVNVVVRSGPSPTS